MKLEQEAIRGWVAEVCREANLGGLSDEFADRVLVRLDKGEREYGTGDYRERGIDGVLAEAAEEGVDIPGWLVLGVVLLYEALDRGMDPQRMQDIHGRLVTAAAHGVRARAEIEAARAELGSLN